MVRTEEHGARNSERRMRKRKSFSKGFHATSGLNIGFFLSEQCLKWLLSRNGCKILKTSRSVAIIVKALAARGTYMRQFV